MRPNSDTPAAGSPSGRRAPRRGPSSPASSTPAPTKAARAQAASSQPQKPAGKLPAMTPAQDATTRLTAVTAAPSAVNAPEKNIPAPAPVALVPPAVPSTVDAAYTPTKSYAATVPSVSTAAAAASVPLVAEQVDPALHLARRASWGATPALVEEIRKVGVSAWLDAQLNPLKAVRDTDMDALAARWPRMAMTVTQVHDTYPNGTGDLGYDTIRLYLARAIWSRRQLLEVMVDFWHNHLVVSAPWADPWDSVHRFNQDVIRKFALGRYADMLVAAAKHPSMLQQLDNAFSTKKAPNENFGRELLELHTVGVDGGYAESDIRTSALILTGISTEPESGEYFYRAIRHHIGPLSVLGWSHPNPQSNGEAVAVSYLTYLARHPKTARRLATKLAVRFVQDEPPSSLIDRLASTYLANDTAIAPVLRALFTSPEFAAAGSMKVKRPLEDIVSTVRLRGYTPGENVEGFMADLHWWSSNAGQAPLGWPAPNGYPDVSGAWSAAGATLTLWNFHMGAMWATTTAKSAVPDLRTLLLPPALPTTYGGYIDALADRLLMVPLPADKKAALCAFLDKVPTDTLKSTDAAVTWRLPYVAALITDTPEFTKR